VTGKTRLVSLVYLVYLVCFVELNQPDEQNKQDKPNQPSLVTRISPRSLVTRYDQKPNNSSIFLTAYPMLGLVR
jgi:hypothetical protein